MAAKEKTNFPIEKRSLRKRIHIEMTQNWDLYLLILPVLAYFIIFCYYPMYGAQIAFRDYRPTRGIAGSEWVGLEHFIPSCSAT